MTKWVQLNYTGQVALETYGVLHFGVSEAMLMLDIGSRKSAYRNAMYTFFPRHV